jgi:hypothetical protein
MSDDDVVVTPSPGIHAPLDEPLANSAGEIVCPICGAETIREKCKVLCKSNPRSVTNEQQSVTHVLTQKCYRCPDCAFGEPPLPPITGHLSPITSYKLADGGIIQSFALALELELPLEPLRLRRPTSRTAFSSPFHQTRDAAIAMGVG